MNLVTNHILYHISISIIAKLSTKGEKQSSNANPAVIVKTNYSVSHVTNSIPKHIWLLLLNVNIVPMIIQGPNISKLYIMKE